MFIKVNENEYELSTKLGVSLKLELRFKLPLTQIFDKIAAADINELIDIISLSAGKLSDKAFRNEILDAWDYTDLQYTVQELIARLMFTGTDDEVEAKVEKYPLGETQKNLIRKMLGIPLKSSEQPTESE